MTIFLRNDLDLMIENRTKDLQEWMEEIEGCDQALKYPGLGIAQQQTLLDRKSVYQMRAREAQRELKHLTGEDR